MKNANPVKIAIFALAAAFLFMGSFLLFAALSGTPLHELAVVGGMFPAPEEEIDPEPADVLEEIEEDQRPEEIVVQSAAVPLQSFLLQSPFSTEELDELQRKLQAKITENEALRSDLLMRSAELDVRETNLENRWRELEEIRSALTGRELELAQRDQELARDEAAQKEREKASWAGISSMFTDGDPGDLTDKLLEIAPEKAALVLRALPGERAAELLNALTAEDYRIYMDEYRKAGL